MNARTPRCFALALALATIAPALFAATDTPKPAVIHQLRIYELFAPNRQAFHDRFRDHAMRIMAKYGFKILHTWEATAPGKTEFIYLLEWPDAETMKDRWAKFMADAEWARIKKETAGVHGQFVERIDERALIPTPYSPSAQSGARNTR